MKAPPFAYARPTTLDGALQLLADHDDAKVLAGGQSLLPVMNLRLGAPALLVDISRIPMLDRIVVDADGAITIGALVTHASVEASAEIARHAPLVAQAAPYIGHRAIRNRGTCVGSIAHADPAAEMPAVCLVTDALMIATSTTGDRVIKASEFFTGFLDTALREDELLAAVRFPPAPPGTTGAIVEVSRRHGDYALAGLACRLRLDDEARIVDAALAYFGVGPTAIRVPDAEQALLGTSGTGPALDAAVAAVIDSLDPPADVHGTSSYRKHLAGVLCRRGVDQALHAAAGASEANRESA